MKLSETKLRAGGQVVVQVEETAAAQILLCACTSVRLSVRHHPNTIPPHSPSSSFPSRLARQTDRQKGHREGEGERERERRKCGGGGRRWDWMMGV
jgi:hypothetical protein